MEIPRHILIYTDDPGIYGAAQYNHAIACGLRKMGYRVTLAQAERSHKLVKERAEVGVEHIWLASEEFASSLSDPSDGQRVLTHVRPDVVLFSNCCPLSNFAAKRIAGDTGVPYVVVDHFVAPYLAERFDNLLAELDQHYRRAVELISVSQENLLLLRQYFRLPSNRGRVIHLGRPDVYFEPRDPNIRRSLRADIGISDDFVVVFTAARMEAVKGFQYQLKAIAALREEPVFQRLCFVWAGAGSMLESLRELVQRERLGDHVKVLGERSDVRQWLDASDIFLLPSEAEGMPFAVMEAMAKGLPVAATGVSGIPEELGDTGKLLSPPIPDPKPMVAEIVDVLRLWANDKGLRQQLGAACRTRAQAMFQEQRMIDETRDLINQAMAHSNREALAATRAVPQLETAVCMFIFRRPEETARVFEMIRRARPKRLFIVADGPRPNVAGEIQKVTATRAVVERVDWDCQVRRDYAETNMGLRRRIPSGLDWVFREVEEAIILEDDCLPSDSFFPFCQEMLARYRNNEQVMMVAGSNNHFGLPQSPYSYCFTLYTFIWGWATWRRAWRLCDMEMKAWPQRRDTDWLKNLLGDEEAVTFWSGYFEQFYRGCPSWDFPWTFNCWHRGALAVYPSVNLISNIGFTAEGSGNISTLPPTFVGLFSNAPRGELDFPLKHPPAVERKPEMDLFLQRIHFSLHPAEIRRRYADAWSADGAHWIKDSYLCANAGHIINSGLASNGDNLGESVSPNSPPSILAKPLPPLDSIDGLPSLLIAMLYQRADAIDGLPLNIEHLPQWLHAGYLKFLLAAPSLFVQYGESERYAAFLERWMDAIWDHICNDPVADLWSRAALEFLAKGNFIGVYFSKQNLRALYEKRGRLLEGILRGLGYAVDHQFGPRPADRRKIRLGILASHYSPQTETFTTLPAYKHLSRDRYEIVLFTTQESKNRMERYCAGHADTLVVLPPELPEQVRTIRNTDCDVLWIGTNVTAVSNAVTLLALHRLGRIQVTSTSSCTTTGMRNVDYYISGSLCEPHDAQQQYTEKLLLMDGPAHCMDFGAEAKPLATQKPTRGELQMESHEVLFASGANFFKVIPEVQTAWIKILAAVPQSRLMLYPFNLNWSANYPVQAFLDRFKKAMTEAGVSQDRLIVLAPAPNRADVLNRLRLADIYLDSFPFSGVNSLLDPLEIALPPVVMEGNSFRSLMAPSLMRELKIPELIAADEAAYVAQAARLANDPAARKDFSERIQKGMANRPRFINSEWYSGEVDRLLTQILAERGVT